MSEVSDDDLILSYRATLKPEVITEIFLRYSDNVYRMALRMSGNQADAEDAMQTSFIKCMRHLNQYQIGTNFKAWLMRIVINTCKQKFNEEKRRSARELKVSHEKDKTKMDNDTSEENEELKQTVKKCVFQLPEKYREPIWLVLYEGFSYPEVAMTLALPEKTVRTQVSRGLERIRGTLASMGIFKNIAIISVLISSSKLEAAPASAMKIIKSIGSNQHLAKGSVVLKNESSRFLGVGIKTASSVAKSSVAKTTWLTLLTGLTIASSTYFFAVANKKEEPTEIVSNQVQEPEIVYTSHTWSFHEKEDPDIRVLEGSWKWSQEDNAMVTPINERVAIALPIKAQDKPFVIEIDLFSRVTEKNQNMDVSFGIDWEYKDRTVKQEEIAFSTTLKPSPYNPKIKIYFYQNYVAIFTGGSHNSLKIYSEDLKDAYPVINYVNFILRKITSKTLETPPPELLEAIQRRKK